MPRKPQQAALRSYQPFFLAPAHAHIAAHLRIDGVGARLATGMIAEITMRLLATCLLFSLTLPVSAQIYQYKDTNGNTVYTNQPPQGQDAEQVQLSPTNSVEMKAPSSTDVAEPTAQASKAYKLLALADLPSDEALRANNGSFSVTVRIDPALMNGHRLRLVLDGKPYGAAGTSTQLMVKNLTRGEHSLAVDVLLGERSLQRSDAINFTVQRVDTKSPAFPQPTPTPPIVDPNKPYDPSKPSYPVQKPNITPGKPNYTPTKPSYIPPKPNYKSAP